LIKEEKMLKAIEKFSQEFLSVCKNKPIRIITHYDTDGITSAAILAKTFRRMDLKFSLRIVKGLDPIVLKEELAKNENETLFFSDLASGSLDYFKDLKNTIFVIDHHEINKEGLNEKIKILNPHLFGEEELCAAALCYLFAKSLSEKNKELSKLALIGMVGDRHETLSKNYHQILSDCPELNIKKGLLIFSATRPIKRALEYSTSLYIPGVTGSSLGTFELLRELSIQPERTLEELNPEEMSRLITSVLLKRTGQKDSDNILGNIYILKFHNRKEDVRELSVLINACSRLGYQDIAFLFCMEYPSSYSQAQDIYIKYRREIVSALKNADALEKIKGQGFVILNAKDSIKDTIIGTITSILSSSPIYEEGTILIGMAYHENKIKVSARIVGKGRNLKELLQTSVSQIKAEVGGHNQAAGCLIDRQDENTFIETLKKNLEIEVLRV
jgi:RecJ-like exonuclease